MEYFFIGLLAGIAGYFSIQWIYNWIEGLRKRVESLRWDLERYSMMQEQWVQFQAWRREQKEN
jgi:hypothetical protein